MFAGEKGQCNVEMIDTCPETLFHYCALDTFLKITDTRTIRLCDMRKSNDAMETKWIIKHAISLITPIINARSMDFERALTPYKDAQLSTDDLDEILKDSTTKGMDIMKTINTTMTFSGSTTFKLNERSGKGVSDSTVWGDMLLMNEMRAPMISFMNQALKEEDSKAWAMCFSCVPDSLSQWRGYGDDGAGVMIGFSSQYLKYMQTASLPLKNYCIGLSEVLYPQTTEDFMRILNMEGIESEESISQILKRCINALRLAQQLPPIYKHPSFTDEKEWRVYFMINDPREVWYDEKGIINDDSYFSGQFTLQKKSFYTRRNQIVSFVPFEIQNLNMAIKSVCIGPKSKVTINDIRNVLVQSGIIKNINDNSIEITVSKSSYQ